MSPSEFISEPQMSAEPQAGRTVVPIWLIIVTFLLLYWAATYFDAHGGWFDEHIYPPYKNLDQVARFQPPTAGAEYVGNGKRVYEAVCALCHDSTGVGKPGQAPPLVKSEWVVSEGVNRLIRIPQVGLNGPIEVNGQSYNMSMAPMGAALSDKDLADVLSYIRNTWGNKDAPVKVEQVKAVRAELGTRNQPYTAEELKALPEATK
jgi:mono/diheme cytochrome c family protein